MLNYAFIEAKPMFTDRPDKFDLVLDLNQMEDTLDSVEVSASGDSARVRVRLSAEELVAVAALASAGSGADWLAGRGLRQD